MLYLLCKKLKVKHTLTSFNLDDLELTPSRPLADLVEKLRNQDSPDIQLSYFYFEGMRACL